MFKPMHGERGERGQALVVIVFALVGLLVVAGLAIDGGMVFLDRRRMQNAADAAALAGTRLLARAICEESASDDAAIAAEVNHYAEKNGVPDTDAEAGASVTGNVVADYVDFHEVVLGRVGGGAIPNGATGVSVTVGIRRPTYFVSLVGIDTAGASAAALAMTGRPLMGGGIRPFGIPYPVVNALDDGDCFDISFGNCDQDECNINYTGGQDQHRGWMNLAYVWNNTEASQFPRAISSNPSGELKDWMRDGWDGTLYADCPWNAGCHNGDYIHAKPGTEQDVINVAPLDTLIYVPIYDAFPDCDGVAPDIAAPYPQSPNACTGMQGADYYHIVGFAGVRIRSTSTPDHSMHMCLEQTIMGQGQPSSSAGYGSDVCAMHTMVVTLWK
jgi:Flp pilus assembly protein TadG